MLTPSSLTLMGLIYLFSVPCNLANLGCMFYPLCSNLRFEENGIFYLFGLVLQITLPLLLAWVGIHTFSQCTMEYFFFSVIHCNSLINYIRTFYKLFLTNSHEKFSKCNQVFREIQILTHSYDCIHKGHLALTAIALCAYVFIISFYAISSLSHKLIFSQLASFAIFVFDAPIIIVEIDGTFKPGVLKASKAVLDNVGNHTVNSVVSKLILMLQMRYVKSWPVFKIYTGSTNFYEEQTALVLLDFIITQVVNLLIL